MKPTPQVNPSSQQTADHVARTFFGASSDPASHQAAIRSWLVGAGVSAVLIPIICGSLVVSQPRYRSDPHCMLVS